MVVDYQDQEEMVVLEEVVEELPGDQVIHLQFHLHKVIMAVMTADQVLQEKQAVAAVVPVQLEEILTEEQQVTAVLV